MVALEYRFLGYLFFCTTLGLSGGWSTSRWAKNLQAILGCKYEWSSSSSFQLLDFKSYSITRPGSLIFLLSILR